MQNDLPEQCEAISRRNSMQHSFLARSSSELRKDERAQLERYITYCAGQGVTIELLADCYDLIVKDTLTEQLYFQRNKRYRFSRYADVAASVYHNTEYMTKYMHGLALTSWWVDPGHVAACYHSGQSRTPHAHAAPSPQSSAPIRTPVPGRDKAPCCSRLDNGPSLAPENPLPSPCPHRRRCHNKAAYHTSRPSRYSCG